MQSSDEQKSNSVGAGAPPIDPDLLSPAVLARIDAMATKRSAPDSVAFLRNRAEDARNDIARVEFEARPEYEYLAREFDRAADELECARTAIRKAEA